MLDMRHAERVTLCPGHCRAIDTIERDSCGPARHERDDQAYQFAREQQEGQEQRMIRLRQFWLARLFHVTLSWVVVDTAVIFVSRREMLVTKYFTFLKGVAHA